MKNMLNCKTLFILILLVNFSREAISQSNQVSVKSKIVSAFTKKKQIAALNIKVDSLNKVVQSKNNLIKQKEDSISYLLSDIQNKNNSLSDNNLKINQLEQDLNRKKVVLDSLNHVIADNQAYSIFQRNEDSLRYQNLLRKLSDRNTFIVDSLKASQNIRKSKQEPTKVETYYFKDFKSVITGVPDEKNRYTYTFELFHKNGEEYVKAENASLFNDKKQDLLDIINKRIQKDFNSSYKIDPKCFTSKNPPIYDFKKLGIEFKDGKINFYAVFDFTTPNCYYLYGYTSVEFTVDELKDYLN